MSDKGYLSQPRQSDSSTEPTRISASGFLRELGETALLAIAVFVLLRFVVQNFRIEGHSMEPNLHNGQFLIVDKISYKFVEPKRGDVVVFRAPPNPSKDFIKRVIGLPGEEIEIRGGIVLVDGRPLDEPYVLHPGNRSWGPRQVGPDELFVLGDNRASSNDSRQWGMLPRDQVIGKALLCYWPPEYWGLVRHVSYINEP